MAQELLFSGGRVRTFDPARPEARAVAVRDGVVVGVGGLREARRAVSAAAEPVDLAGGLLVPGLRDAHVHPLYGGLDMLGCDLSALPDDAAAYVAWIAAYAAATPGLWLTGGGWSMGAFPAGTPTAALLDAAVPDRPCYMVNRDRHGAWLNTAGLRAAGITGATPDPPDGRVERDAHGEPTGMLHEGATALVAHVLPAPDTATCRRALLRAQQHLHALGITGWQDAIVGRYLGYPDAYDAYRDIDAAGLLTATVTGALWWDRDRGLGQLPDLVARRELAGDGNRFRATTVKIMADGVVENGTAALLGHRCGSGFLDAAQLAAAVGALDEAGFPVHIHTIGDRAVRDALDAIAALPRPGRHRHQLAHVQVVDPMDVPRFGRLGAVANVQMLWACAEEQMTRLTLPLLGMERGENQYPFASLRRTGAVLAAGSDWPVSTADPFAQIAVGVTRVAGSQPPFLPAERLELDDALRAFTAGAAYADHRADRGTITTGSVADLTVLGTDPYRLEPAALPDVRATSTWVAGRCVWSAT